MKLNAKGYLQQADRNNCDPNDIYSTTPPTQVVKKSMEFRAHQLFTYNQQMSYRNADIAPASNDKITQFRPQPTEIMELFPSVGNYFWWFKIAKKQVSSSDIADVIDEDVTQFTWVDGVGRKVLMCKNSFGEVMCHLEELSENDLTCDSAELRSYLMVMSDEKRAEERFVYNNSSERDLPIPIFSSVTPHSAIPFLLHIMLMCGQYETELDLKECQTMRESLVKAKLIGPATDEESLKEYSNSLLKLTMDEVYTRQPVSLRKVDDFSLVAKALFDMVLFEDNVPNMELPPCILTKLLDSKSDELREVWRGTKANHIDAIYHTLPATLPIPSKEDVTACNRKTAVVWNTDPEDAFVKLPEQSDLSYKK